MTLRVMVTALGVLCGCATGTTVSGGGLGKGGVFIEPNFPRETVNIRRVAVIPNRLPANLLDPEKWRRSNYQLVRKEFESRGFEVVDYDTAVNAFERSGLPVEDTKSSREKFAEFSQELGVDAVVVPYYGTFSWTSSVFVVSTSHFATVSSFQIYLAERNDFLARIDTSAETGYTTGYGTITGLVVLMAGSFLPALVPPMTSIDMRTGRVTTSGGTGPLSTILQGVGGGLMLGDILGGAIAAGKAPDGYWEEAFAASIKKGLEPFFDAFRPSYGGAARAPQRRAPVQAPPASSTPAYPVPTPGYPPAPVQGYQPAPGYPPPVTQPRPAPSPYQEPVAPPSRGCASDQECKGGRICVQGTCTAPATTTCSSTADCPSGKVCLQGQCL